MCSCCCGCIKNFAVRIIYTIIILAIFVVLGLIPIDAMTAYGSFFGVPEINNANGSSVNVSNSRQVNLDGIFYKITWVKNGLTLFDNSGKTCGIYNPKQENITKNVSVYDLDYTFTKFTTLGKYNVTCFAYLNNSNEQVKQISKVYLGSLGAIVALALVAVIAILCVFFCCAGWCSCSCCFLCKSCCLLKGG